MIVLLVGIILIAVLVVWCIARFGAARLGHGNERYVTRPEFNAFRAVCEIERLRWMSSRRRFDAALCVELEADPDDPPEWEVDDEG